MLIGKPMVDWGFVDHVLEPFGQLSEPHGFQLAGNLLGLGSGGLAAFLSVDSRQYGSDPSRILARGRWVKASLYPCIAKRCC